MRFITYISLILILISTSVSMLKPKKFQKILKTKYLKKNILFDPIFYECDRGEKCKQILLHHWRIWQNFLFSDVTFSAVFI